MLGQRYGWVEDPAVELRHMSVQDWPWTSLVEGCMQEQHLVRHGMLQIVRLTAEDDGAMFLTWWWRSIVVHSICIVVVVVRSVNGGWCKAPSLELTSRNKPSVISQWRQAPLHPSLSMYVSADEEDNCYEEDCANY